MESSHGRNVGTARLCNDCVFTTKNPAQLQNSKVRNSIDGFPCVLYINDELQGIYNFNADRYSNNVFGYTDPDKTLVYEISANSDTTAGAFNAWRSESTVKVPMKYYKDSISGDNTFNKTGGFCTQYIKVTPGSSITFNPGSLWTTSSIELLLYNDMDNTRQGLIKKGNTTTIGNSINYIRVNCWETTYTTLPSDTININGKDYNLSQTVTASDIETEYIQSISIGTSKSELDYYKSDFTCIYPPTRAAGNDNFSEIKRLVEWVDGASDEDFRDNLEQYFNKEYLIRYLIIVQLFALVDSLGLIWLK